MLRATLSLFLLGLLACDAGTENPGSGGATAQGGGSSSGFGAGEGTGAFQSQGGASACQNHCTPDLRTYVDCDGNVLAECPPDKGCSPDGSCVDPCDAAKANQSTIGCEFYSATTPVVFGSRGGCFAAMIANTWTTPIAISAEYNGVAIDAAAFTYVPSGGGNLSYTPLQDGLLQPNQLGILFLSQYQSGDVFQIDCPMPSALVENTQIAASGVGQAFHITTNAPVVAYDVYPWGGASSYATSATLLLPTASWGTNFVTSDAWKAQNGSPFTQIVAAEDGTAVTVAPSADILGGGGVPPIPKGAAGSFTLNRGQLLQILQTDRLAGSLIQSDKPISVWGGSNCMNIPEGMDACDAAHQELLPVQTLGSEYIGARYPSRGGDDQAPYTIVGLVDGTTLTFDPPIPGAPAALSRGQVAIFSTDQPFLVRSQDEDHPFHVAAHMTGGSTNSEGLGDPEYVNLVSPKQYLDRYLFVTDPTYGHTALVFTRQKGKDGTFADVNLDCLGPVTQWQPVGAAGDTEVARVMIVSGGAGVGNCANGMHAAQSALPFGLTVWGYDYYASYAYPAGMHTKPINNVVVPPVPR